MSAGIERVVIIATATPRPTFHKIGGYDPTGGYYGQGALETACGLPWLHYRNSAPLHYRNSAPLHGHAVVIRRPHAEAFGRPCGRCFR